MEQSDYEKAREEKIARNRALLEQLGLGVQTPIEKAAAKATKPKPTTPKSATPAEKRTSLRLVTKERVDYNDQKKKKKPKKPKKWVVEEEEGSEPEEPEEPTRRTSRRNSSKAWTNYDLLSSEEEEPPKPRSATKKRKTLEWVTSSDEEENTWFNQRRNSAKKRRKTDWISDELPDDEEEDVRPVTRSKRVVLEADSLSSNELTSSSIEEIPAQMETISNSRSRRKITPKKFYGDDSSDEAPKKTPPKRSIIFKPPKPEFNKVDESSSSVEDLPGVRIMFTCIPKTESDKLTTLILELGGEVVEEAKRSTHLITNTLSQRTLKLFAGIRFSKFVLTSKWILDSHASGRFLEEEQYWVQDPNAEQKWSFNIRNSIANSVPRGVFKGSYFYLFKQTNPDLSKVINNAGGKVVTQVSQLEGKANTSHLFVILDASQSNNIWETPVVDPDNPTLGESPAPLVSVYEVFPPRKVHFMDKEFIFVSILQQVLALTTNLTISPKPPPSPPPIPMVPVEEKVSPRSVYNTRAKGKVVDLTQNS